MMASVAVVTASSQASAQEKAVDADEIARQLANPNNSLASLTFKSQYRWYEGDLPGADNQSNYTLLFQPVLPFTIGKTESGGDATFFLRPAIPLLVDQPTFSAATGSFRGVTALGDIGFDVGYGVTEKNGLLWAVGAVGTLPTATNSAAGGGQFRFGPEALLAKFEPWGLYGVFPGHQWNVVGDSYQFSTSTAQFFLIGLPGDGWSVGSTPNLSYDWVNDDWTIPVNLTVSKTVTIGSLPVKLAAEANYYVVRPDAFGPEWMIGFSITPVVPNFLDGLFR